MIMKGKITSSLKITLTKKIFMVFYGKLPETVRDARLEVVTV